MTSVFFALDADTVSSKEPGAIIIAPRKISKYLSIECDIILPSLSKPDHHLKLRGFFGFIDKRKDPFSSLELIDKLKGSPNGQINAEKLPNFFTMFPEISIYRKVVSFFGPEYSLKLLLNLHDVIAADEHFPTPQWLHDVKKNHIFKRQFLQSSEAFFVWTNAGSILHGLEHEKTGRISNSLSIRFQMASRPNEHNLHFKFNVNENILPRRFAIIIGENGVGKSQTLRHIAKAALAGSKDLTNGEGGRPSLNRLLAFAPTSTTYSVFPNDRLRNSKVWYRRFALAHPGGPRGRHTTAELIIRLARSEEKIRTNSRLQLFLNAITAIDNWQEIGLRTEDGFRDTVRFESLLDLDEKNKAKILSIIETGFEPVRLIQGHDYPLSSGEQSFLRFAAIASLYIENSSLVLFDEPETHLHPHFISQFVSVLDNLLEQTGSAAIIATHSVYFVREAFEDQVVVLRSDKNRNVLVEKPTLKTFGADVGSISYFVFDEDKPSRLARQVERRITNTSKSWAETFDRYKDELSLELLGEIRALIDPSEPTDKT